MIGMIWWESVRLGLGGDEILPLRCEFIKVHITLYIENSNSAQLTQGTKPP